MTPEQLATLLTKAVPEMRWTVDGFSVTGHCDRVFVYAHWRSDGADNGRALLRREDDWRLVTTHACNPWRMLPEGRVCDDLARAVWELLDGERAAPWARGLNARAQVLFCERTVTERAAAMKNAVDAYNDAVTALRSAQAHLEAVQDG